MIYPKISKSVKIINYCQIKAVPSYRDSSHCIQFANTSMSAGLLYYLARVSTCSIHIPAVSRPPDRSHSDQVSTLCAFLSAL